MSIVFTSLAASLYSYLIYTTVPTRTVLGWLEYLIYHVVLSSTVPETMVVTMVGLSSFRRVLDKHPIHTETFGGIPV